MNATAQARKGNDTKASANGGKVTKSTSGSAEGTAPEGTSTETPAEEKPDPFADLPRITLADTPEVLDLTGVEGNNPFKYAKAHEAAVALKQPVQVGWKHSTAMFIPGTNKGGENGFRAGSVYGTIADIVSRAGRAGITAHEVVAQVRIRQIGNKRSKYCEKLPPVGWAEGWINTAVTKNIIGVHATKRAPALMVPPAPAEEAKTGEQEKQAA